MTWDNGRKKLSQQLILKGFSHVQPRKDPWCLINATINTEAAGTPIGMSGAYCSGRSLGDAVDEDVKHLGSVVGIDGSVGENYVEVKGGTEHPNRGHGVDAVA